MLFYLFFTILLIFFFLVFIQTGSATLLGRYGTRTGTGTLKVLTNEKRGGLKVVEFDRFPFKLFTLVPRVQREEDQVRPDCSSAPTQLALCLRFALLKGESWQRAVTLDDSQTPTPVLHNTSVVV
jgi:hypothetical protein